jgi:hypothetical protein
MNGKGKKHPASVKKESGVKTVRRSKSLEQKLDIIHCLKEARKHVLLFCGTKGNLIIYAKVYL